MFKKIIFHLAKYSIIYAFLLSAFIFIFQNISKAEPKEINILLISLIFFLIIHVPLAIIKSKFMFCNGLFSLDNNSFLKIKDKEAIEYGLDLWKDGCDYIKVSEDCFFYTYDDPISIYFSENEGEENNTKCSLKLILKGKDEFNYKYFYTMYKELGIKDKNCNLGKILIGLIKETAQEKKDELIPLLRGLKKEIGNGKLAKEKILKILNNKHLPKLLSEIIIHSCEFSGIPVSLKFD